MVSTYTDNGRFTKQGTDDNPNTWGEKLNDEVFDLLDEAIFGVLDINISGSSNYTLSTNNGNTDEARHAVLELTGAIGADIDLLVPSIENVYFIRTAWTGDFTVSLKISGSGTQVDMERDKSYVVYTNGTDSYNLVDLSAALATVNNLSDLTDVSAARTNLGLGDMAVQNASSVTITGGSVTGITDITIADGGTGASSAADARTNLDVYSTSEVDTAVAAVLRPLCVATISTSTNTISYQEGSLISSVAYQGGGDTLVTLSETMTDTNYVVVATAQSSTSGGSFISVRDKTTTSFEYRLFNISADGNSTSLSNTFDVSLIIYGETV